MISPLAHVDPEAVIGKDVTIHPFAFISKNTVIGDGAVIYPYASILNGARIGARTKVYNGAIIGAEPQSFHWHGEPSLCIVGDDCLVREHTIINRSIYEGKATTIGNKCFIMAESHIMHDAVIDDYVVVGNGTQVAGSAHVRSYTILSSNALVHAGSDVGRWVLIKGGCRVAGNVPPFTVFAHNPAVYSGVNAVPMRRGGKMSDDTIDNVAKCYRHIYESGTSVFNALRRIELDVEPCAERDEVIAYIREHELSIIGISGHTDVFD